MLTQTSTGLIARYYNEIASQPDVAKACEVADEILTLEFIFHPPNDTEGQHGLARHKQFLVWHHGVAPDQQFMVETSWLTPAGPRSAGVYEVRIAESFSVFRRPAGISGSLESTICT